MADQTAEALAAHPLGEAAGRCLLACWVVDAADGGARPIPRRDNNCNTGRGPDGATE